MEAVRIRLRNLADLLYTVYNFFLARIHFSKQHNSDV